jgi:hypothetical protein
MTRVRLMSKGIEPASSCSFRRGAANVPDPAKAQLLLQATPSPPIDVDEFRRRRRDCELADRLKELGRRNAEAWLDQSAFIAGNRRLKDADWRGM